MLGNSRNDQCLDSTAVRRPDNRNKGGQPINVNCEEGELVCAHLGLRSTLGVQPCALGPFSKGVGSKLGLTPDLL